MPCEVTTNRFFFQITTQYLLSNYYHFMQKSFRLLDEIFCRHFSTFQWYYVYIPVLPPGYCDQGVPLLHLDRHHCLKDGWQNYGGEHAGSSY